MPGSVLGGLLALLLLVATTASVSHALHEALHHGDTGSSHLCLACTLAKGQVSAAAVALLSATILCLFFWDLRLSDTLAFAGADYRISPSRAPPLP